MPLGRPGGGTSCYRILRDPLVTHLVGSSGIPPPPQQVSMILFHPVPAFITVLPVLFCFDDLPVAPTEEAHLLKRERRIRFQVVGKVYLWSDQTLQVKNVILISTGSSPNHNKYDHYLTESIYNKNYLS